MAAKKGTTFYIGLALVVIGVLQLLHSLGAIKPFQHWWVPIILIIVGILVIINRKGTVNILGWICLIYGGLLLLTTLGLFSLPILWQLTPAYWILFGLILIL